MKYTFQKIAVVAFCSIFISTGLPTLLHAIKHGGREFDYMFGGVFVFLPIVVGSYWWRQLSRLVCNNERIHVRALMNRTFHREHFCTQCGKTLYYSPEQG